MFSFASKSLNSIGVTLFAFTIMELTYTLIHEVRAGPLGTAVMGLRIFIGLTIWPKVRPYAGVIFRPGGKRGRHAAGGGLVVLVAIVLIVCALLA